MNKEQFKEELKKIKHRINKTTRNATRKIL